MQLEPPFLVAESKLVTYLLAPLPKNDKSKCLRLAGYELDNWPILAKDLLTLAETQEAVFEAASVRTFIQYNRTFNRP